MRTLHKRSLMPAAIGVTAIAWVARVLSGRLDADRGDRSDCGDYMRTSLKQRRRQRRQGRDKFAYLTLEKKKVFFHALHERFSILYTSQPFWCFLRGEMPCFAVVWTTWALDNFFYL